MAIRIPTTHHWTQLFYLIRVFAFIATLGIIFGILNIFMGHNDVFDIILGIGGFIGIIAIQAIYINSFFTYIETYLYVVVTLKTKISFSEAKYLVYLFAPNDSGKWYPMTGIKDLPIDQRRKVLFESAKNIYDELDNDVDEELPKDEYTPSNQGKMHVDIIAMLCYISNADGKFNKEEYAVIYKFLTTKLKMHPNDVQDAINNTNINRNSFESHAHNFYELNKGSTKLLNALVQLLIRVAYADGELSVEEEILINTVITIFGTGKAIFDKIKNQHLSNIQRESKEQYFCRMFGFQLGCSFNELKSTYRNLAKKYHPDKVSHLGDGLRNLAEIKMKEINEAYVYLNNLYS